MTSFDSFSSAPTTTAPTTAGPTTAAPTTAAHTTAAPTTAAPTTFINGGCYQDCAGGRIWPNHVKNNMTAMTPSKCRHICFEENNFLFGKFSLLG